MKRTISLILVFMLCFGLCACGTNDDSVSKYTGTYIKQSGGKGGDDAAAIETTLILSADGTGSMVEKVKSPSAYDYLLYGYSAGYCFAKYELTWEDNDGYLFIKATGTRYNYKGESKSEFTESYELKGKVLYTLEGVCTDFIKE